MNAISRLELWTGRLPIRNTIETLVVLAVLAVMLLLSGCGTTNYEAYTKAVQAKALADGEAAVEREKAAAEKWKALGANATTPEGRTALGMVALASELILARAAPASADPGIAPPRTAMQEAREWFREAVSFVREAKDIYAITESGRTERTRIAGNVRMREIDGERDVKLVDAAGKNGGIHIAAGGDVANAGGRNDRRDCRSTGGTGGNGAPGGSGAAGGTGSATTGAGGNGGAAAPGASGGSGAGGGAATSNCN
jgi:Tfp pilus assembly protein PilE